MQFTVQAMERGEFDAWVAQQQAATPSAAPPPPSGAPSVTLSAVSVTEGFNPSTLSAPGGQPIVFNFTNADTSGQPHNVAIKAANPDGTDWSGMPIANAGQSATYVSPPLSPGTYEFYCAVHPNMKEYKTVEEIGHPEPENRDPVKAWPRRLVPIFAAVIALSFLVALAPIGLTYLNSLTPPSAGPTAVAVPAVPEISASTAVHFDTTTLIVPANRPFDLVFNNKQEGVPHNVRIDDSPAGATILFDGDEITGVADITYHVPAIAPGDYYFLCRVHPNMNGTLTALQETGGPAAPGAPGAPGGPPPSGPSPQP